MRPRLVEYLNHYFDTHLFGYIIPDPAFVYAIMLGLGIIIFIRRCDKINLDRQHSTGLVLWASVAALLGARIFYLLQHIGSVISNPSVLLEINGATVSFGVYLGGVFGLYLYHRFYKIDISRYLDTIASVLGIGPMIGRMACFLNGDDYGKLSNLHWSVRYPHGSFPFLDQVAKGLINPMDDLSMPVHPVQLYGCLKGVVLFVVFSYLWKKNYFKPGVLFCLFWPCYAVMRFILEYFRGDMNRGFVGAFSTGQIMSLLICCASLIYITIKYKGKIKKEHVLTNEYAL